MKLIILNGSSCSGKTTILKKIMKERENLFHFSHDTLKWLFSQYKYDKHSKDVHKVLLAIAQKIFQLGYDVISDSSLIRESREKLIKLATENNYEIVEINLEADWDILLKRFNERVESALLVPEKDRRISNLSVDRFKELYDTYNKEKNPLAITFKTDTQSIEEIFNNIISFF